MDGVDRRRVPGPVPAQAGSGPSNADRLPVRLPDDLAPAVGPDAESFSYSWRGTLYVAGQILRDLLF